MKSPIIYSIIAAALLGGTLAAEAQEAVSPIVSTPESAAWKTPDKLRQTLAARIIKNLSDISTKQVTTFIKNPENLRLLLLYRLAEAETGASEGYARYNENLTRAVNQKLEAISQLEKEVGAKNGPEKDNAMYRLSCARKDLKVLQREAKYPADLSKCGKVLQAILSDNEWMEQIAYSGELHNFTRVVQIIAAVAEGDTIALR